MRVKKEVDIALLIVFIILFVGFAGYIGFVNQQVALLPANGGSVQPEDIPKEPFVESPGVIDIGEVDIIRPDYVIHMKSLKFVPADLVINVGDSVTFVNDDTRSYRFYEGSVQQLFNVFVSAGESYTLTFNEKGTFSFKEATFAFMKGSIVVK